MEMTDVVAMVKNCHRARVATPEGKPSREAPAMVYLMHQPALQFGPIVVGEFIKVFVECLH